MNRRRWVWIVLAALGTAGWVAACSSSEDTLAPTTTGSSIGGAGGHADAGGQGGVWFDSGPQICGSSAECDGGVCVAGSCCPSADRVCGEACCTTSEVCLFGQCVLPGDPCVNAADCPDGYYCETALGEPSDGGVADAGPDAACTQPLPAKGKCVPAPVVCQGDAGADAGDGGCIPPCEYHPPVGQLNAVVKWKWGYDPDPVEYSGRPDVWSTPAVARIYDANCDGKVDMSDPPQLVFVSGNAMQNCCQCTGQSPSQCQTGVLRMLDGASGKEIWSLDQAKPGVYGFAGVSVAVGDIDGDKQLDILALTGDGYLAMIDAHGQVLRLSDHPAGGATGDGFGWGGALSLGDMDGDGFPEISYGHTLFETTNGALTRLWVGAQGEGASPDYPTLSTAISHFVDLDGDGQLELLAGRTAYRKDGTLLWNKAGNDGFTAVGDFDGDGAPEVVLVASGTLRVLRGIDGSDWLGPLTLPGTGAGGPPTVADFDGDGEREIGVAQQNFYSVIKPDLGTLTLTVLWSQTNHDMSSAVTGSSVFDFEGDGKAEVVYKDECYQWVYDGATGAVLFTTSAQSFTATEASLVADVDGDGHAEMVIVNNSADPTQWTCAEHNAPGVIVPPHTQAFPVWTPAPSGPGYRGITVLGDAANSWVGTRTLWNQHAYHVTNICDPRDSACGPGAYYGQIPPHELDNWQQPWLNDFRQNVQDKGLFDAPDATVSLSVQCVTPVAMAVSVRNLGLAGLPAGVNVDVVKVGSPETVLGTVSTSHPLLPGQTEVIPFVAPGGQATTTDTFLARIVIDPANPTFHECRDDNNESAPVQPECVQ